MTGHVLEAREVTRSAFASSGEPGSSQLNVQFLCRKSLHVVNVARIQTAIPLIHGGPGCQCINIPSSLSPPTSSLCCRSSMASTRRPQHGHLTSPPSTQRALSPPPPNQRAQRGYHDPHSLSSLSRSSSMQNRASPMLESSSQTSSSRPSSPCPSRTQDVDNLCLRHKISALEDTINRLESAGGSSKKRYEYAIINKGTKLTFNLILPAGQILHFSLDVESVRLQIYIMIYPSYWQK
jgi:hypothetical protein